MKKQTYREFIVVRKGGHEVTAAKAPKAVTLDYARKVGYHWAKVLDYEDEETEEPIYRRMRQDELAFIMPWERGREAYRDPVNGRLVCCYLPVMDVLGAIERGETTLDAMCKHDPYMRERRDFFAGICEGLVRDGYIVNTENGYKFNP